MKSAIIQYVNKVRHFLLKKRLHPIRVFLFHQVSDSFDESTMKKGDWTNTSEMQSYLTQLKKHYTFISLEEAYHHLKNDTIRFRDYAVLTADDGWASLSNILPWLHQQQIPITIFVNPAYMDGKHFRENDTEKYLSHEDIDRYVNQYPGISIGLHGMEHIPLSGMSDEQLHAYINQSIRATQTMPNYIPFWAYTWGVGAPASDSLLHSNGIIPVYIDSEINVDDASCIHRELLDGGYFLHPKRKYE